MEALIEYDFKFVDFSKLLGEFYVECAESYPEGVITKVTHHYPYTKDAIYLNFSCPEHVAVVLKLRFGHCITVRPPKPEISKDASDKYTFIKYIKNRNNIKIDNEYYFDYESIAAGKISISEEEAEYKKFAELAKLYAKKIYNKNSYE